eukprot:223933_1
MVSVSQCALIAAFCIDNLQSACDTSIANIDEAQSTITERRSVRLHITKTDNSKLVDINGEERKKDIKLRRNVNYEVILPPSQQQVEYNQLMQLMHSVIMIIYCRMMHMWKVMRLDIVLRKAAERLLTRLK